MSRVRGALLLLAATVLLLGAANPSTSEAEPPLRDSGLTFQPQLGVPGLNTVIGSSPGEAPEEVWATGNIGSVPAMVDGLEVGNASVLLRRSRGTSWQIIPVTDRNGNQLSFNGTPQVTYNGGVAMLSAETTGQTILTRDPGGAFFSAAGAPPLLAGEKLASGALQPLMSALDEPSHTGALLVPAVPSAKAPGVLHFDGTAWAREPICMEPESAPAATEPCAGAPNLTPVRSLTILAIGASSPQNAWLLASGPGKPLALFRRTTVAGSGAVWEQSWAPPEDEPVSARKGGQMLTVTSAGVWVDARYERRADISLLFEPSSPGTLLGRWCYPEVCGGASLGASLPEEYSSFASSSGGALGTRIISGLSGGALLRFQGGGDFRYVVGATGTSLNAEFFGESLEEGWLSGVSGGRDGAKVERVSANPEPTLGTQQAWPLPFRRPLLAIAPQPGTSPGDPDAQVLAVGDQGQVARFEPGVGWSPEFLYNSAGVVQTAPAARCRLA